MKKFITLTILGLSTLILPTASAGPMPVGPNTGIQKKDPVVPSGIFDLDQDKDGVPIPQDNCPGAPNHDQKDDNHNGIGDDCPVTLAGNGLSYCVKLDGGKARCWGWNQYGQMANGSTEDQLIPVTVFELNRFYEVDFSQDHRACGIIDTGTRQVVCWGFDMANYAADFYDTNYFTHPYLELGINGGAKDLAMGDQHICMVSTGGHLYCWGLNDDGEVGQPSEHYVFDPTRVDGLDNVEAAASGRDHTCAIAVDGHVYCWGDNSRGQLGNHQANGGHAPQKVSNLGKAKALWAGTFWTCAEEEDGTVKCWGEYPEGEPALPDHSVPTAMPSFKGAKKIIESSTDFCGLLGDGRVTCNNAPILQDVVDLAGGFTGACAIKKDGSAYCWGGGYLGDGVIGQHPNPAKVKFTPL